MARRLVHAATAMMLVVCLSLTEGSMTAAAAKRLHVGRGSVAAGSAHTVMAAPDGRVLAWGAGGSGQIGDGGLVDRLTPVQVAGLENVVAVSAGAAHTVALTATGEVYAWGANTFGRLGDGTSERRIHPVLVHGLASVTMIAAGSAHNLALTTNGTVYAWGRNASGQLGIGNRTSSLVPVPIAGLPSIVAVAAGDNHSLAVSGDGRLFAWGDNQLSTLGDGTTTDRDRPVSIALTEVVAVAGGAGHSLALRRDGSVYSWGQGANGALGTGSNRTAMTPKIVTGLSARAIAAGRQFSAAIRTDGTVATWGANDAGQLGDHTTTSRDRPVVVDGLTSVASLALGDAHAIAVSSLGDVRTWGEGDAGRLGTGALADQSTPFEIISDIPDWGVEPGQETEPPEPPAITPTTGFYPLAITVSLTPAVTTDVIRFTLDGSEPTPSSAIYSAPFSVASSATVSARSYSSSGEASAIRSETYTIDTVPPSITASTSPPLHDGWMTAPVTVSFDCMDDVAVASCPPPVTVSTDGLRQVVGTAIDRAGNRATAIVTIRLDQDPPLLWIADPADQITTTDTDITVTGTAVDSGSGVIDARCNGKAVAATAGAISCIVGLRPGRNDIVLQALDAVGHSASAAITITRTGTPTGLMLTPRTRTLEVSEVASLTLRDEYGAAVTGASWTTSEAAIVALSDADPPLLSAGAIGTAVVTASKDGLIAEATIVVSPGLAPGDVRWTIPTTPTYSAEPPIFANRVAADVPAMFTVETLGRGDALLKAVNDEGEVMWQQQAGGIPIMGDSFGGLLVAVLDDVDPYADYRGYSRIGGGTAKPWRFQSNGGLGWPVQAHDGTLYAIEFLPGGLDVDGKVILDKHLVVIDGATGRLLSRTLLPREVDQFVAARDGQVIASTPPILCQSRRLEYAPDTVGPLAGADGRGYLLVRRYEQVKRADCVLPFRQRPDRTITMGIDLMIFSPSSPPETVEIFSTSCAGTLGTTLPCDLPVRATQLMPDGIGGTLATWERGTEMVEQLVFVQKSLTRIDESGSVERDVSRQFWLEMMGQAGVAITSGEGSWTAMDVVTGESKWTNPLPNLTAIAVRPDGGVAAFDWNTSELRMTNAQGDIESTQTFGLDWLAVHDSGDWIGRRDNEVLSIVGEFSDATRWSGLKGNAQGQQTLREPGIGIFAKTHLAFDQIGDVSRFRHVSIRVVPRNWQSWIEKGVALPGTDEFDNAFFTLGAGLGDNDTSLLCEGTLVSNLNRSADYLTPPRDALESLRFPPALEDRVVEALLTRDAAYGDDLPYACFPERFYNAGFFNSNSYAHGLLNAVGLPTPRLPERFPGLVPGWLTPIPLAKFQ